MLYVFKQYVSQRVIQKSLVSYIHSNHLSLSVIWMEHQCPKLNALPLRLCLVLLNAVSGTLRALPSVFESKHLISSTPSGVCLYK